MFPFTTMARRRRARRQHAPSPEPVSPDAGDRVEAALEPVFDACARLQVPTAYMLGRAVQVQLEVHCDEVETIEARQQALRLRAREALTALATFVGDLPGVDLDDSIRDRPAAEHLIAISRHAAGRKARP